MVCVVHFQNTYNNNNKELAMQEMDQEKLIEYVRLYEPLYVMTHAKYSDIRFKENAWKEIGKRIKQPGIVCKKTWTNLRDSFRRALKNKRETKSGRSASKIKKWKFEDEMTFLKPHLQDREACNNPGKDTDDNNDDEDGEENQDSADNTDDSRKYKEDNKEDDMDDNSASGIDYDNPRVQDKRITRKKGTNRKIVKPVTGVKKGNKFGSNPVVIDYSVDNKRKISSAPIRQESNKEPCNEIDTFFSSIASTVKGFSPYYKNIAKSQIFKIITDLEMKQIMQNQQNEFESPNTSTQNVSYTSMSTTVSTENLESYNTEEEPHDLPCSSSSVSYGEILIKKE